MQYLNQISHPLKLIESKVNFFADYFIFAASNITVSDKLDLENYLSLIEKITFQLQTNTSNCPKYIDSYLTHPLVQKENKYFKEYKNYNTVSELFEQYKKLTKTSLKLKWITENPDFKTAMIRFSIELKKVMFKKSLKSIINFLKCSHNLNEHEQDLIHHTNILVNEFFYTNRTYKDIIEIFTKVITADVDTFPFPESFLKSNKNNLLKAKEEFLSKRTFDQQFEGILNILKKPGINEYLIYRIYNVQAFNGFRFKYNEVTFYDKNHPKLKEIKTKIKNAPLSKNFFKREDMILASIKVRTQSKNIAEQIAVNIIKRELTFLDFMSSTNSVLEPHSYITTSDFKNFSSKWSQRENSFVIKEQNKKNFDKNPFLLLKDADKNCRDHFLNYEHLYIKAQISGNPEDFWHYFETLLKISTKNTENVINIISSILSLTAKENEKELIDLYMFNSITNSEIDQLSMTRIEYLKMIRLGFNNIDEIVKNIHHPFINYLKKNRDKSNLNILKSYYARILWDCYSQRNSMMHSNQKFEKGLVLIDLKLPNLAIRFRKTLIKSMTDNNQLNFKQLIDKLII